MNTNEYIKNLSYHLRKMPAQEREDAISYYREYLEDAGIQTEEEAVSIFGPAPQLAAGIKADSAMRDFDEGAPKVKKGISAVWLAILGVFAIPVGVPLAIAAFVIIIAILIVIFSVIISFFAVAISFIAGGAASIILGFWVITSGPMTTLFLIGSGLVLMALGYFIWIFMVWLSKVSLKGIATLFNRIRYGKENRKKKNNGFGMNQNNQQNYEFDNNPNCQQNRDFEEPPAFNKSFAENIEDRTYSEPIMDGPKAFGDVEIDPEKEGDEI